MVESFTAKEFTIVSIGDKKDSKTGFYRIIKTTDKDIVVWNKEIGFKAGDRIKATELSVSTKFGFQYRSSDNTAFTVLADSHHEPLQVTEPTGKDSPILPGLEVSVLLTCPHCGRNSSVRIK